MHVLKREHREPKSASSPTSLHADLQSALAQFRPEHSDKAEQSVDRIFVIGGATLYKETLELPPSTPAFVDRILLTRIISPSFEECDVFLPDFRRNGEEVVNPWSRSSHAELQAWVGFDVPEGVQEEKGVRYEFQMWTR